MRIFNIAYDPWYILSIELNWPLLVIIILVVFICVFLVRKLPLHNHLKSIEVDTVALGIGQSAITLKYNKKDREVAYKLWVELTTRKIGLPFDKENDVIVEIYDSWYSFFGIARELMKEIPIEQIGKSSELICLTTKVLNEGLRPYLTIWQAKFRKWYDNAIKLPENYGLTPQEIQQKYELYDKMVEDLAIANSKIVKMQETMYNIAFGK